MGGHLSHLERLRDSDVLNASCGPVCGNVYKMDDGKILKGYLGIPYAEDLVRFQKSKPAAKWTDPLACHEFGPSCPQIDPGVYAQQTPSLQIDEHKCLTLNVFTPTWRSAEFTTGFPVMVFIHGGGWEFGSSSAYCDYSMAGSLCPKDVLVVSINYRVGPLGFFTTGDSTCPGNFGLWDQTLALKWVQSHIGSFGGDPNNVTVFGQSAGGANSDLLALSPHSRDLFNRSICMSGSADCNFAVRTRDEQVRASLFYAKQKGFDGDDVHEALEWMKKQDVEVMNSSFISADKPTGERGFVHFCPWLDGDFFPRPTRVLRSETRKTMIFGVTKCEGLFFDLLLRNLPPLDAVKRYLELRIVDKDFGPHTEEVRQQIYDFYFTGVDTTSTSEVDRVRVKMMSNDFFTGAITSAIESTKKGWDAYLYEFHHFTANSFGTLNNLLARQEATHCIDIRYVLGEGMISKFEPTKEDSIMHEKMTTWWTNFAKYGNPNGKNGGQLWEKFELDKPSRFFRIDLIPGMVDDFQENQTELLWKKINEESANLSAVWF